MTRIGKQIIFGVIYGSIFLGFIIFVYYSFIKQAPSCVDKKQNQDETGVDCGGNICGPCLGTPKDIEVSFNKIFFVNDPIVIVRLSNPNNYVGAKKLDYKIDVLDAEQNVIKSLDGETFIYPGDQEKNLVFPLLGLTNARTLRVNIKEPEWLLVKDFERADFTFVRSVKKIENGRIFIEGEIKSNEKLLFGDVEIGAFFYDKTKAMVGVSKTKVQDVKPYETRAFTIEFPYGNLTLNPDATKLYYDALRP